MPEKRVIIAFIGLILLGGLIIILYGLLGGTIGQPPETQNSLPSLLNLAMNALTPLPVI